MNLSIVIRKKVIKGFERMIEEYSIRYLKMLNYEQLKRLI